MNLEKNKQIANEIFGIFEKQKNGQCSYDRALEDAARLLENFANEQPIVGYVKSGTIREVLADLYLSKKADPDKSYMFDCKVHQNEMDTIKRIINS